jgi:predicted pyridoxine 5'-phosphate oxidase superfamily flavin-nucleotide-binding protein
MASVSESGWPYVQHRGGPAGFLKVLDSKTLGFADYRGNRQYESVGNLLKDDRVAMILMDYPHRMRLKILGHARIVPFAETGAGPRRGSLRNLPRAPGINSFLHHAGRMYAGS